MDCTPIQKEDERLLNIREDQDYDKWTPGQVAIYIMDHFRRIPVPSEVSKIINRLVTDKKIDGKFLKEVSSLKKLKPSEKMDGNRKEWCDLVWDINDAIMEQLPEAEYQRGEFHPFLEAVYDIPFRLGQLDSGVWNTALQFYTRAPTYDQVYDDEKLWCHDRGGRPYFAPTGWRRYGFVPLKEGETIDSLSELFKDWHVAYHGTAFMNIKSITEMGLVPPGTKLKNDQVTKNFNGKAGCRGEKVPIYVSPSVEYAAHHLYTKPKKSGNIYIFAVFQVRVRPDSFQTQKNTLAERLWGDVNVIYDQLYSPIDLEWLLYNPDDIRVTGLMIKTDTREPTESVKARFELNKKFQIDRQNLAKTPGQWQWNCDNERTLARDGNFKYYPPEQNKLIEDAFRNGQIAVWVGKVRTPNGNEIPYFINFEKEEQVNCTDNTRRRRIRRIQKT